MAFTVATIICAILAFFLGGIPFGLIVGRAFGKQDLRKEGSGNTGTTNAMRTMGVGPGVLVFLLDALKGALAISIMHIGVSTAASFSGEFTLLTSTAAHRVATLALLSVVLGHIFSPYLGFKGGKGIATAVGGLLAFIPVTALALIVLFAVLVIVTRTVSIGSIAAAACLVPVAFFFDVKDGVALLMLLGVTVFVIWAHRGNIRKLMRGEEKQFAIEKKSNGS